MADICIENGYVERLDSEGLALVKVTRTEACARCEAAGACNALGAAEEEVHIQARNDAHALEGDRVKLAMGRAVMLKASAMLYMLPTAAFIGGALLGVVTGPSLGLGKNASAMLFAFGGLLLSFLSLWSYSKRSSAAKEYRPRVVAVLSKKDEASEIPYQAS